MNDLHKIVVVDDGDRTPDCALSAELAEMGYASVTTSLEASEDVLELISSPTAILLQMPDRRRGPNYTRFMELAARLRARQQGSGIPVIIVDRASAFQSGGYASLLQSEFAAQALSKPDF